MPTQPEPDINMWTGCKRPRIINLQQRVPGTGGGCVSSCQLKMVECWIWRGKRLKWRTWPDTTAEEANEKWFSVGLYPRQHIEHTVARWKQWKTGYYVRARLGLEYSKLTVQKYFPWSSRTILADSCRYWGYTNCHGAITYSWWGSEKANKRRLTYKTILSKRPLFPSLVINML